MNLEKNRKVIAVANQFIRNARYYLTTREQKLIICMSSFINKDDSDFNTYLVPVNDLKLIFEDGDDKKYGSFYERLDDLLDSITDKKISFPSDFEVDGQRMRGYINWVAGAMPRKNEDGILCVEFAFSPQMKPFMLGLKEKYTQVELKEVSRMKSGFSIRIFQICKSYYHEHGRHGRNIYTVTITELKELLGIEDKYPDFRNLRRKVLDVARQEINDKTGLRIEYNYVRHGRKIAEISITITENVEEGEVISVKTARKNRVVDTSKVGDLREAQMRGVEKLRKFGLNDKIIIGEVLPIIKGSEIEGYEDHFVNLMLSFFEQKTDRTTKPEKVKAFVGWLRNERFTDANLYASFTEKIIVAKKKLSDEEAYNRERAKTMNYQAFRAEFGKGSK